MEFVHILRFGEQLQVDDPSGFCGERVMNLTQIARHGSEQVRWFGKRIGPNSIMSACIAIHSTFFEQIAIGQEDGTRFDIGFESDPLKDGHVVWTVGIICDTTESKCLTLCAIHRSTLVQARQLCVGFGDDFYHCFDNVSFLWMFQYEFAGFEGIINPLGQFFPVDAQVKERDARLVTVQHELVTVLLIHQRIAFQREFGGDRSLVISNVNVHGDSRNDEREGLVIFAKNLDGSGFGFDRRRSHGGIECSRSRRGERSTAAVSSAARDEEGGGGAHSTVRRLLPQGSPHGVQDDATPSPPRRRGGGGSDDPKGPPWLLAMVGR